MFKSLAYKVGAFALGAVIATAFGLAVWLGVTVLRWLLSHFKHWVLSTPHAGDVITVVLLLLLGAFFLAMLWAVLQFIYEIGKEAIKAFKFARLVFKAMPEVEEGKQVSIPLE